MSSRYLSVAIPDGPGVSPAAMKTWRSGVPRLDSVFATSVGVALPLRDYRRLGFFGGKGRGQPDGWTRDSQQVVLYIYFLIHITTVMGDMQLPGRHRRPICDGHIKPVVIPDLRPVVKICVVLVGTL
jgi:hypothetical protein